MICKDCRLNPGRGKRIKAQKALIQAVRDFIVASREHGVKDEVIRNHVNNVSEYADFS